MRRFLPPVLLALVLVAPVQATTPMPQPPPDRVPQRLADRMADQCTDRFCMDANTYTVACNRRRCTVTLYGWFFRDDTPIGDFACTRPTVDGRAVGKTACGDDPTNPQTYPWPESSCGRVDFGDGPEVVCWDAPFPPAKTLHKPLRRVAFRGECCGLLAAD